MQEMQRKSKQILGFVWIQLKTEKYYSKIIFNYVNSTVGLFLIKNLLKSEIYNFINSAYLTLFIKKKVKHFG